MKNYTMSPDDASIEWEYIPGYAGRYQVSKTGLVRRLFETRTHPAKSLLTITVTKSGYHMVALNRLDKWCHCSVHRLVMLVFVGQCPDGMEVNHIDGNKANNHLSNLEYVTHQQNIQHTFDKLGRKHAPGSLSVNAKLTEGDVIEIRRLYAEGVKHTALAARYGVTYQNIIRVAKRISWKHI